MGARSIEASRNGGHSSRPLPSSDRRARRPGSAGRLERWLSSLCLCFLACAVPDRPAGLPDPLPNAALQVLQPDSQRTLRLGQGASYRYVWSDSGPWAVHLVQVDLGRCDLALAVVPAGPDRPGAGARVKVSDLVAGGRPGSLAAVNGDFFTAEGAPVGVEVSEGEVLRAARRPTFAWRPGQPPWIGLSTVRGRTLTLGWELDRDRGDGMTEAIGGFPELLDAGRRVGDLEVAARPSFAAARHPRTAVAYRQTDARLFLIVVDGRQQGYSAGMTLPELTTLLEALGATEALNLDGGGSSMMVLRGRPVSRPSDAEGERAVVNALEVRREPALCRRATP